MFERNYQKGERVHAVCYAADNRTILYRGEAIVEQHTTLCRHPRPETCMCADTPIVLVRGTNNQVYGITQPGDIRAL